MLTACVRNPLAWLVRRQVSKGRSDARRVVFKQADSGIAAGAQKAANRASLVVMVYRKVLLYAGARLRDAGAFADRARSTLSRMQRVVLVWLYAKACAAVAVCRDSIVLLSILRAPLGLPRMAAWAAVPLQPIHLAACLRELGLGLHRFAGAAPLHAFWRFWPALREVVVSAKVTQRLPLNPTKVLSVPGCNWRWSATAALARAFRNVGHHAFPSHLDFSNTIKGKE